MTSMESLSLQASQEVPVLRHETLLAGETSVSYKGKARVPHSKDLALFLGSE